MMDSYFSSSSSGGVGSQLSYQISKSNYAMINDLYTPTIDFSFNEHTGRMSVNGARLTLGQVIMIECYVALEPIDFPNIFNERFIKQYASTLVKLQVGTNTKKYKGIKLAGGGELDGQTMYEEAKEELRELEEKFSEEYEFQALMLIG